MSDSPLNPIQSEEVGVCVNAQPKQYYPNEVECKSLHFIDVTVFPILYEGVLPFITIRCPIK